MEHVAKKNKAMRVGTGVLLATLATTWVFSGVLAKYISSDYGIDTARVAKFGVVTSATGNLFGASYAGATDNGIQVWDTNKETVSASGTAGSAPMVVAPGTKNESGMTLSVKGTPEVSTKLTVDRPEGTSGDADNMDYANADIVLNQGAYSVMEKVTPASGQITRENADGYYKLSSRSFAALDANDFDANEVLKSGITTVYKRINLTSETSTDSNYMNGDYKPISWKVGNTACADVAAVDAEVINALTGNNDATNLATKRPNETWGESGNVAQVTWEWAFGNAWAEFDNEMLPNWENTSIRDLEDTVLGQMMVNALGANDQTSNYLIAKGNDLVQYKSVNAGTSTDEAANSIWVAYTGNVAPYFADDNGICACLTVSYGARVTVEQID